MTQQTSQASRIEDRPRGGVRERDAEWRTGFERTRIVPPIRRLRGFSGLAIWRA